MKPQLSPLNLLDFAIINSTFRFITPPDETDIRKLMTTYELDIDFAIVKDGANTRIFIKASINQGESAKHGYSIFAEGIALFSLTEDPKLKEEDKKSLLQYSAVSIAVNSLRGFISSLTANAPFGRYTLPSVDVNDLFRQKRLQISKQQVVKKKKAK